MTQHAGDDTRGAPVACVRLPALSLQIANRKSPRDTSPLAVVEDERHDAPLVLLNAAARKALLTPGMRRGTAQSLVPMLRVHVVSAEDVRRATRELVIALQALTPRVEHDTTHSGVFYVDPSGLGYVHGGVEPFTLVLERALDAYGYRAAITLAFDRHTAYVLACGRSTGRLVTTSPEHARSLAARVPLRRLGLSPDLIRALTRLGLYRVGALMDLPVDAVHARLGEEASRLAHALHETAPLPLQPLAYDAPIERSIDIEPPEADSERLLFLSRLHFADLLREASARGVSVVALRIVLSLDHGPTIETRLEPASPTRDVVLLTELWRLRLATLTLVAAVARLHVGTELTVRTGEQLALFRPKRDVKAASRALARVRAAFGDDAVVHATLRDAHLPEGRFVFTPSLDVADAKPRQVSGFPLVRRIHGAPYVLTPDPRHLVLASDTIRMSGGWWRHLVDREYLYGETPEGVLLFFYLDRVRELYFVHGEVD